MTLEVRRWQMNPTPTDLDSSQSGRTHCPVGRPIYESSDVPAVLATESTLRLRRLRPGRLQAPIATQRSTRRSGRSIPLYAIADTEPIPTTSSKQATQIQRRRTCAQCGHISQEPFTEARDGKRYCDSHIDEANKRALAAEQARDRVSCADWAREALEDDSTVLVAMLGPSGPAPFRIRIEDVSGTVVLDQTVPAEQFPDEIEILMGTVANEDLPDWLFTREAQLLCDHRLLLIATLEAEKMYTSLLRAAGVKANLRHLRSDSNNNILRRYRVWNGQAPMKESRRHRLLTAGLDSWFPPPRRFKDLTAEEIVFEMRTMLLEMAEASSAIED
ncbi:hypothetical protein LWC34_44865 [Kibdelosporangium philippinense]|uniref:Uncharacterized protein n=1 Tax=Kibdelosporangium philippinense TaxID=211113 RepID=A0ABS8ZQ98_9PSEU|nr:hypothetical protein [Kibdelosporangium philippinense]MCE7009890.1 hypothetical protein [Kibdelosporangium philippinense]